MTRKRLFSLIVALLLIALSWWGVAAARTGLVTRTFSDTFSDKGLPMLYVAPEGFEQGSEKIPGVLVAHGYAGSKQLMLGYAHVLAHAGYAVMLWDFGGHGANPAPLQRDSLQQDLNVAYAALLEQPEVDPSRLALLGHSMGSGAVMSAGIRNPDRFAATVAVSPTGAGVTPSIPRNLQLQAGSWEGGFVKNAQRLLAAAGGENDNFAGGRARSLVIIPNAEHITILLRNISHQAARTWLDATFRIQSSSNYIDRRMAWYALHLLAWLLFLFAIAPAVADPATTPKPKVHPLQSWLGSLLAPFLASASLLLLSRMGEIDSLGGVLVGGAIGIWFFVAGVVWLGILLRLQRPTLRALGIGLGLFVLLWVGFGAMAQSVWLQWWLIPARLKLWPLLSLACLPWFLASGVAQQDTGVLSRVAWWLWQSVLLVGGFILAVYLVPQLGFIYLLLPLFPLAMGIFSFAGSQLNNVWSYALGSALFFGWAIVAAFPLAS
ncbi:alpha/beta fold hydrolase [Coleofasciculus sp. FACHB-T130]|uniref:alpha/beta fold hydrolase n=1 Tax=Cyanophyceae TaxID=3028117 RepID=UPI00168884C8|nr:alpha/beta fold hydrolase [Coleofasciculus sp. FACHB-T130]MBD1879801.1 alpha/beta fold hydrolase [Coleofasciculus sp. FACHB-T130]